MEQLDFFKDLNSSQKKDEKLVQILLEEIKPVKYLRTNIRLSLELPDGQKELALIEVEKVLYNLAMLCFKKSRYTGPLRYNDFQWFYKLTKDTKELGMDFPASTETLKELTTSVGTRLIGILNGQKERLKGHGLQIDNIISAFKYLNYTLSQ